MGLLNLYPVLWYTIGLCKAVIMVFHKSCVIYSYPNPLDTEGESIDPDFVAFSLPPWLTSSRSQASPVKVFPLTCDGTSPGCKVSRVSPLCLDQADCFLSFIVGRDLGKMESHEVWVDCRSNIKFIVMLVSEKQTWWEVCVPRQWESEQGNVRGQPVWLARKRLKRGCWLGQDE